MDKYMKTIALWQSFQISSSADLDKYLDSFRVLFAYNSGKIENDEITCHNTREIFENGKSPVSAATLARYWSSKIKSFAMNCLRTGLFKGNL